MVWILVFFRIPGFSLTQEIGIGQVCWFSLTQEIGSDSSAGFFLRLGFRGFSVYWFSVSRIWSGT